MLRFIHLCCDSGWPMLAKRTPCGPFYWQGLNINPCTKTSDAELWCFLSSAPEPTVEQTLETPVIWDTTALIVTSLWCMMSSWIPLLYLMASMDLLVKSGGVIISMKAGLGCGGPPVRLSSTSRMRPMIVRIQCVPAVTHFDGLVQERRNSSALAMELRISCINPSICNSLALS